MHRRLDLADAYLLFISSQSQGKAYSVADQIAGRKSILDNRVFFFGDPEHLLVDYLIASNLPRPVITNPESHRAHGWVFDHGMVQPAVIALAADASVIFQWSTKPSLLNVAGKLDRPDPWDVWDRIEHRLDRVRLATVRLARSTTLSLPTTTTPSNIPSLPQPYRPHSASSDPSSHLSPELQQQPAHLRVLRSVPRMSLHDLFASPSSHPQSPPFVHPSENIPLPSQPPLSPTYASHNPPSDSLQNTNTPVFSAPSHPSHPPEHEIDLIPAPLSTGIDSLMRATHDESPSLAREEPDMSEGDVASGRVRGLSASINALASEVLAENTLPSGAPDAQCVATLPKLAEDVVRADGRFKVVKDDDVATTPTLPSTVPLEMALLSDAKEAGSGGDSVSEFEEEGINSSDEVEPAEELVDLDSNVFVDDYSKWTSSRHENVNSMDVSTATSVFRTHPALSDALDTSVASVGSDQVDSSAVITKHASVRTEDSGNINMLNYESSSFPSEKRIAEEADDKKTDISDYLKELKDQSKLKDPRYRRRYDTFPLNAPGSAGMRAQSVARPGAPSDYIFSRDFNVSPNVTLVQDLIQRETNISFVDGPKCVDSQPESFVVEGEKETKSIAEALPGIPATPALPVRKENMGRGNVIRTSQDSPHPGTASPHPEAGGARLGVIDVSPFADANNDLNDPQDGFMKPSLRDEYEAYDEYIVCEYELEEYVEEYESDGFSKSKSLFASDVIEEGSQGDSCAVEGEKKRGLLHFDPRKVVDVKGSAPLGRNERRLKVWKDEHRLGADDVGFSDEGETNRMDNGEKHAGAGSQGMSPVRKVLRKIRGPVMSVGRRGTVRSIEEGKEEGNMRLGDGVNIGSERDTSKVSRKDTLRAVLRKMPTGSRDRGDEEEEMTGGGNEEGEDEHMAKLGRKETIKSVLRKIPVPKTMKRSQTVEGVLETQKSGGRDEDGSTSRLSKRSGLQAVLQRLPSLSTSGRNHRGSLRVGGDVGGGNGGGEARDMQALVDGVVEQVRATDRGRVGQWDSDSDSDLHARVEGVRRGDTGGNGKRGHLRRSISRLRNGEARMIDDEEGGRENRVVGHNGEGEGTGDIGIGGGAGAGAGAGGVEGRRKLRWRRRGEDEEDGGEKVGAKMSFAVVGERILSRFKMAG